MAIPTATRKETIPVAANIHASDPCTTAAPVKQNNNTESRQANMKGMG
jgi:hypothetical protein